MPIFPSQGLIKLAELIGFEPTDAISDTSAFPVLRLKPGSATTPTNTLWRRAQDLNLWEPFDPFELATRRNKPDSASPPFPTRPHSRGSVLTLSFIYAPTRPSKACSPPPVCLACWLGSACGRFRPPSFSSPAPNFLPRQKIAPSAAATGRAMSKSNWWSRGELNPQRLSAHAPQACVFANFTTGPIWRRR